MGSLKQANWTLLLASFLVFSACPSKSAVSAFDAAPTPTPVPAAEDLPSASLQVPSNQLVRVDITQPGGETTSLSRSSGRWRTTSPLAYPANHPALESIVAVLAEIEIRGRVAAHAQPKHRVAAGSGIVVQAWTQEGAQQAFTIGASQGEETLVQRVGEDAVYAVRGRCRRFFDLSFQQLRDPTITSLDATAIERVTYFSPFGEFTIVASPETPGAFVEAKASIRNFDNERATKNVAVLAKLFAKDFVDPPIDKEATGLFSASTSRIVVSVRDQREPLTLFVGAQNKDGKLHLRVSGSEQIYLVSGHLASSLVPQKKHFERSDKEMQERRAEPRAPKVSANAKAPEPASKHTHGSPPPTRVPPALMSELRGFAQQQRN